MTKRLLRSGCMADFLALGENGQTLIALAPQIRESLRLRGLHAVVECLAIPQRHENSTRIDWYAAQGRHLTSWAAADPALRKSALQHLENCVLEVNTLSQRCLQSQNTSVQLFGALLPRVMQFPGSQHVYLIDGKPVIAFWSFVARDQHAQEDALACLRIFEEQEPVDVAAPSAPPEPIVVTPLPAPVEEEKEELDDPEPVIVQLSQPSSATVVTSPALLAEQERRQRSRLPAFAAIVLAAIALSGTLFWQQNVLPPVHPMVPPVAPASAAPAVAALLPMSLPLQQAVVVLPPAPEPKPEENAKTAPVLEAEKTVPTTVAPAKNALYLPPRAVKAGSTRFMNGTWRVNIASADPIVGKASGLNYVVKDNTGTVNVLLDNSLRCRATFSLALQPSGTLLIRKHGRALCSDGKPFLLPEIACIQKNGTAVCRGKQEDGTDVPVTIRRLSN